jgi:glycosyltransferase 2 family protein
VLNKKTTASLLLSIVISALALYLAFINVPLSDLAAYLATINTAWIIPAVLVVLFSFALRALRWQIILASTQKISFWSAYHPMMIGFMINCILPGRIGEVARPVILKKKEGVPFTAGLATVATERVFDAGFLIAFFAVVLSVVDIDPTISIPFGQYTLNRGTLMTIGTGLFQLCLVGIAGILVISIDATRNLLIAFIERSPAFFFFLKKQHREIIKQTVCRQTINIINNFSDGFAMVKSPLKLAACTGLSATIWVLSAVAYYLMLLGCPGINLSFVELSAVMIIICFFIALPSVPGFWGIWEAGGVFAMTLFGVPAREAAGFTLANHAVQMFPIIIAGLFSAVLTGVKIRQFAGTKMEITDDTT